MKHLSLTSRCMIEKYIAFGYSFREIAGELGYQPSTISREVKKYRTFVTPKSPHCALFNECKKQHNCNTEQCAEFQPARCKKLDKAPFVCNNCPSQDFCSREHAYYHARKADAKSHSVKSSSRQSIHLDEDEVKQLNSLVSPLIKNGQSLSHIYANHSDEIIVARRTLYNYVDKCVLDARNIDLPRKVRYKKRKKKDTETYPYTYREGRTYEDFKAYVEQHPELCVVEMDTVKGRREKGKCLLTMIFTKYDFMLIFLLETASQECVEEVFNMLQNSLGIYIFRRLFPVILTDNGSEFKDPTFMEKSRYGSLCTNVFYCDRMASWQKPHIEKAHEDIRKVLPKGKSFDNLTQADVTLLANHINSLCRDSLDGKCPYDVAKHRLHIHLIFLLFYHVLTGQFNWLLSFSFARLKYTSKHSVCLYNV